MDWTDGAIVSKPTLRSSILENMPDSLSNFFFQGRGWVSMKSPERLLIEPVF